MAPCPSYRFAALILAFVGLPLALAQRPNSGRAPTSLSELRKLPAGLKVVHDPNPVKASRSGKSTVRREYTWWYKTTVSALESDVKITEFGSYAWHDGHWVFSNYSSEPFSAKEFAEWYSCPEGVLKKGQQYTDPMNWGSAPKLIAVKALWYYIGIDHKGRHVKGAAVIEQKGEIDPKRPTDAAIKNELQTTAYVDLFNGKDLTGWVVEGTANNKDEHPVWAAEDGMIVCKGHGYGFLRYDRKVSDFILALDFRMDRGANSGIGIRHAKFTSERRSRPSFSGYEIQLVDESNKSPSKTSSGSLYRYVAPKTQAIRPAGEWNTILIECRGPNIIVKLNDKLIHDLDQTSIEEIARKPLSGYVSLQNHGGDVEFRNIRLKTLN